MESLLSIDSAVVTWLNQWVGKWEVLDKAAELVVSDYLVPTLLSLALMSTWFLARDGSDRAANQKGVLTALLGVGFSNLTVLIINQFYFRHRPFVDHELELLFYQPTDSSFPANPAAVAFAIAFGVFLYNRALGVALSGLHPCGCCPGCTPGCFTCPTALGAPPSACASPTCFPCSCAS